ncbi:MAG TPA: carboxypeptidase-like regulatory domain-containing protein [Mucilaginibacter sp.]|nr:carboxypeptidase-like regulatory domain-containing protein [Mucilaginibacter sp.]
MRNSCRPACLKKILSLSVFLVIAICSHGQQLKGTITDKYTRLPLSGALVIIENKQAFTDAFGGFIIVAAGTGDTLKVSHPGYKTYKSRVTNTGLLIQIMLEPSEILLDDVVIRSNRKRDFERDSLENRRFYAKQFDYRAPTVTDAFTSKPFKEPGELLTLDLGTLIRAFTKKSTAAYKFNKQLLRDERANFVDQKFNRGLVAKITALKGDTLSEFLIQYRPDFAFAKKTTEYEMELYIKQCYNAFLADLKKGKALKNNLFRSDGDTSSFRLH